MDGRVAGEGSKAMRDWFGDSEQGELLSAWIGRHDQKFGEWFDLSLEAVVDGMLPREITIGQLPKTVNAGERVYTLTYRMVDASDEAGVEPSQEQREFDRPEPAPAQEKMLVMATDVTEQLLKEAQERRQAELLQLFKHISRDKAGFLEFLAEAEELMTALTAGKYADLNQVKRLIHTLKGNSAIFGMQTFSGICHELESRIDEEGIAPSADDIERVECAWNDIREDLKQILGDEEANRIQLEDNDYHAILKAVVDGVEPAAVLRMIESWRLEPTSRRLELIEKQIVGLADRLGKEGLQVSLEANDIRFDSKHFAPFWSYFIHVLRNTVDHGIEDGDRREALGKPRAGHVRFTTEIIDDCFPAADSCGP